MLKQLFAKGLLKDLGNVLQVFKDNKGRFSSKRTVAGVIAAVGAGWVTQLNPETVTVPQMIIPLVCIITAAVIVVMAPKADAHSKDEYPDNK